MIHSIGQGRPDAVAPVLEALTQVIGPQVIERCLRETGRQSVRVRRLPACGVVWLVIAVGLFAEGDLPSIWRQVAGTLARLWQAGAGIKPISKSAIAAARQRLGARVMRRLFCALSVPAADGRTSGAFYCGHRMLALDGQKLLVPDTPAKSIDQEHRP